METILKQGRFLFAIAIFGLGVEHLICARMGQEVFLGEVSIPVIPFVPANQILAYLIGIALIAAAIGMATGVKARFAAIFVGVLFLVTTLLIDISKLPLRPLSINLRTVFFEGLVIGAMSLTLAGTLPEGSVSGRWDRVVNALIKSGPYVFAVSSIVFGIDHFLILQFIADLVPKWIPGAMFWAYFTGAVFIAAGICIATKWMARWAAAALGLMFLVLILVLHGPRVFSAARFHVPSEWSSALIALAMCGGSLVQGLPQRSRALSEHQSHSPARDAEVGMAGT